MSNHRTLLTASAVATLALGGGAVAASAQDDPATPTDATTVTVTKAPKLAPGDTSPFSVPGVKAIRAGKTIPKGFALVGFTVATSGSGPYAGAYLRFACPTGKTLRSFAVKGKAGFRAESTSYPGHRTAFVSSVYRGGTGSVYAVCR